MDAALLELFQCPACSGPLVWRPATWDGDRILDATARCSGCGVSYDVRHGVAVLLPGVVTDAWAETESWLTTLTREQPAVERALLDPDPSALGPADLLFRALALEDRGDFARARQAADLADEGLYTEETRACRDELLDDLVGAVEAGPETGLVVDIATGRGVLVERLAARIDRPIVATDVSPHVLLRTLTALDALGLGQRVSFVACDARRTPFGDGAVPIATTHAGLGNVTEPGSLLGELRRVVSGRFLAVTTFYSRDDDENAAQIQRLGLERVLYRDTLLAELEAAGWSAGIAGSCQARAEPTPASVVVEEAEIDALPAAPAELEWALVEFR